MSFPSLPHPLLLLLQVRIHNLLLSSCFILDPIVIQHYDYPYFVIQEYPIQCLPSMLHTTPSHPHLQSRCLFGEPKKFVLTKPCLNYLTTKPESLNWMLFQCITQCFGTFQSNLVFCLHKTITKKIHLHSSLWFFSQTIQIKIIKSFIDLQHLAQCFRTIVSNLVACCIF